MSQILKNEEHIESVCTARQGIELKIAGAITLLTVLAVAAEMILC